MRGTAQDRGRYHHRKTRPRCGRARASARPGPRRRARRGEARALPVRVKANASMTRRFRHAFAAFACMLAAAPAFAQGYPARPIRMLVPFSAGGTVDIVARVVGAKLAADLGQPFIVENKGGAGGTIAAAMLAKSAGDGYTLMMMHQGLAFNASLYSDLPYDTLRDLAPIALVGATPNALVVTHLLPVKTVQEFLAYARSNPGRIAYGSGGIGSAGHLSVELLQSLTGTKLTHVPYKGSGPAITDLISGQIQAMLLTMPAVMPYVKGGKVRAIATSGARRSPALPDLPTIAEAGVPGYEYTPWYGMFGPGTLPKPLIARLNSAVNTSLAEAGIREKLAQQGLEVQSMTSDQFSGIVRADVARWGKIIGELGVRGE
ncbi:MAG: tripartite tricarboxylate transporter substrate binding protein [Betaproteobacteria bacterium]|nr:MAG: tripartite tricarboxylate transporter substrate binding protein [Betaproteobacteria bacterium]TMH89887.1 MAG: tripartite tricarboxylate transporter substrate binding protein [Betaproteobacteria bacterium]